MSHIVNMVPLMNGEKVHLVDSEPKFPPRVPTNCLKKIYSCLSSAFSISQLDKYMIIVKVDRSRRDIHFLSSVIFYVHVMKFDGSFYYWNTTQ